MCVTRGQGVGAPRSPPSSIPTESPFIIHTVLLGSVAVCCPQGWGPPVHPIFTRAVPPPLPLHPVHYSGTGWPSGSKATSQGPRSWCHSDQARAVPTRKRMLRCGLRSFSKDTWPPLSAPRPHPGQPTRVSAPVTGTGGASFCSLSSARLKLDHL